MPAPASSIDALTIAQLGPLLRARKLSSLEVTESCLQRIERLNPKLNAFITVTAESARREARQADREIQAGKYRGPLHGVPLSIKDLFATRGVRTTAGSEVLANWIPDFDATAVHRLREAGAVIVGKTNMHEFAYGVTNDNAHYGPARNPWNPTLIPGGSSGGSGVAVATVQGFASLGSDTGGSIRIPSAICGTVGLKPTYGRVSRYGAIPLAWSLDHVGVITRCSEDAAIMLKAIAGHDSLDASSSDRTVPDYRDEMRGTVREMKIGVPANYFFEHVNREIASAVRTAISLLEQLGAKLTDVHIANLEPCSAAEAQINLVEATSYHEKWLAEKADEYEDDVRVNLEAGRYLIGTDYVKSQRFRSTLKEDFARVLETVDVIVSPMLPAFPPKIGEEWVQSGDMREDVVDAFLRFAIPYDLTGMPSISIPCGFGTNGLPIGLQIAGRPFAESTVLRVASAYEKATDWHRRMPPLEMQ